MSEVCCCLICDNSLGNQQNHFSCATHCGHVFHKDCLSIWLKKKRNCPKCRATIKKSDLRQLFFDFDPNGERTLEKIQQELISLKEEVKKLKKENENLLLKHCSPDSENRLKSRILKISIENENALSLNNQIHNTNNSGSVINLSNPKNKFLKGGVFFFVENYQNRYKKRMLEVIRNGGSVQLSYSSSRITHLICSTKNHPLVQQGLLDGIRCVTDFWLRDIISKGCMTQPWLAYHFPIPYSSDILLPCAGFQMAILNFDSNERILVKTMIELTGATVVDKISENVIIVSKTLDSRMMQKAFRNKTPLVNVQWLNETLLGHYKYPAEINIEQFNLTNPFSVNYEMVSDFMKAWKFPVISPPQNNELIELDD